jgi:hypothetical protein
VTLSLGKYTAFLVIHIWEIKGVDVRAIEDCCIKIKRGRTG